MPDTRPGITFNHDGVCVACCNYKKQKTIDWNSRKIEFEKLCSKYRGKYGNGYDCAIAVSGGKDSHFQVWYMKEVMKMNPVLLSVGYIDWTETGKKNLANLSDTFSCDIISLMPNRNIARIMAIKAFVDIGSPTWYVDSLIYSYPFKMTAKLGLHLLIYGENVSYTYGGSNDIETPSAKLQSLNGVVKSMQDKWLVDGDVTVKDLEFAYQITAEECDYYGLDPVYLSYFTPWDDVRNYELALRYGFKHLGHEYTREGAIEQYIGIDSLGHLMNQYLKYPKYGHAAATDIASRWIRGGYVTREEMIPFIKKHDKVLDQGVIDHFLSFTSLKTVDFWKIMDKWYNKDLFYQDQWGIWREKFEVGKGL